MQADLPSPDLLLSHGDWVRALARRLVKDEQLAEDVVQEAWIAALAAGRAGDRSGWLAGVVRNLARRALRTRERRRRHELLAHPGNEPALPEEVLGREQLRARLVEAVLALEEPYRSTLLLRYYEDLAPADIARELGMPAATVRTRLKRGLEKLREQLLRDSRNTEPRDWLPALALVAQGGKSSPAPEGLLHTWPLIGGTLLSLKTSLWMAGAAGVLFLLWLAVGSGAGDARGPELALEVPASGPPRAERDPAGAPSVPLRESILEDAAAGRTSAGRVVDDTFSTPVYAVVIPDDGEPIFTDARTGQFSLGSTHLGAARIEVRAAGFSPASIPLELPEGSEELEVRLLPERSAGLRVEYGDGSAVVGARITWRAAAEPSDRTAPEQWIDPPRHTRGETRTTTSDVRGVCRLALATPALVSVVDPRTQARTAVRLLPGQDKRVVVGAVVVLRCVDLKTLEPLAGLELEAWESADPDAMSIALSTDEQGEVSISTGSFPVLVRRAGSGSFQSELIPLSPGAVRQRRTLIQIDAEPVAAPLLLGVRSEYGRVRLLDADTGAPVDAPVRIQAQGERDRGEPGPPSGSTLLTPRCAVGSPREIYRAQDGVLDLPWLLGGTVDAELPALYRNVSFIAAGYHPHQVAQVETAAGEIAELRLEPCETRQLLVVHADGRPFQDHVAIHSRQHDVLLWSETGRRDGLHGPFDWYGGDLHVDLSRTRSWSSRLDSADLAAADVVSLTIPAATGSITVHGVPPEAPPMPLIAKLGVGLGARELQPTTFEAGVYRFEHLTAGTYLVGPRSWVAGAEMQSMAFELFQDPEAHAMRVRVQPGAEARLEWVPAWSSQQPLEGTVRLLGTEPREIFLVPRHGPLGTDAGEADGEPPRMIFGRSKPRLALDENGRYRIAVGEPVPALIAVCVAEPAQAWGTVRDLRVLDVIAPGESADVDTGAVELRWQGPRQDTAVHVGYEIPFQGYRHRLHTFYGRYRAQWKTERPLLIDTIPLHVRELQVMGRRLAIDLVAGETLTLDVEIDQLEETSRR